MVLRKPFTVFTSLLQRCWEGKAMAMAGRRYSVEQLAGQITGLPVFGFLNISRFLQEHLKLIEHNSLAFHTQCMLKTSKVSKSN